MRYVAAMCCAWVAAGGQTCSVDMKNCTHHNSPFDVSEHARVDGPWFDYWLAVGGATKTWDAMDDHQRAWLRVEMTARLAGARQAKGVPFHKHKGQFADDRLEAFRKALHEKKIKTDELAARLAHEVKLGATGTKLSQPDRRTFMILSFQRTGSSWLTDELKLHPCIMCRGERFIKRPKPGVVKRATDPGYEKKPDNYVMWPEESKYRALVGLIDGNIHATTPLDTGFYLEKYSGYNKTREDCAAAPQACGFKWMIAQRISLGWDAWFLRMAVDHDIGLIFLHRTNILKRYYSSVDKKRRDRLNIRAITTNHGRHAPPSLPDFPLPVGSELVEGLEATYEENEMLDRWQAEADERGVRTLRVSFEEMVADKSRALKSISKFILGDHPWCDAGKFSYAAVDEPRTRLHGHPLSDNVTNWRNVVAALKGTKFEKYLTMDGSTLPS